MEVTSKHSNFEPFSIKIENQTEAAILWLAFGGVSHSNINKAKGPMDWYPSRIWDFLRKLQDKHNRGAKSLGVRTYIEMVERLREFENGLQEN